MATMSYKLKWFGWIEVAPCAFLAAGEEIDKAAFLHKWRISWGKRQHWRTVLFHVFF